MATITSIHLTIASGPDPASVVIRLHGPFDLQAAASLQRVVDGILGDSDVIWISVDLRCVRGADISGIASLATAAAFAGLFGAELTVRDPPELLALALESEGLGGLIRTDLLDRRPAVKVTDVERQRSRARHPSCGLRAVGEVIAGPAEGDLLRSIMPRLATPGPGTTHPDEKRPSRKIR